MKVAKEISKYKLDLMGMQEVSWDRGGTGSAGKCTFFYGKYKYKLGTNFFCL
jgi:hypothetical protein